MGAKGGEKSIISVVGAGGKTSCIEGMARALEQMQMKTIVTTTTHMFLPKDWQFFSVETERELEEIKQLLLPERALWVGRFAGGGKMKGIPQECLSKLCALGEVILNEGDGSRRLPLKVPGEEEPVILKESTVVMGVIGLKAIGHPLEEVCFRWEKMASMLKLKKGHLLRPKDVAEVILHAEGLSKGIPKGAQFLVLLNQADEKKRKDAGIEIQEILKKRGFSQSYLAVHGIPIGCESALELVRKF